MERQEIRSEEGEDGRNRHRETRRPGDERHPEVGVAVAGEQRFRGRDVDRRIAHGLEPGVNQPEQTEQNERKEETCRRPLAGVQRHFGKRIAPARPRSTARQLADTGGLTPRRVNFLPQLDVKPGG